MDHQEQEIVKVGEYEIPARLVRLTGCPVEIFESYGNSQLQTFQNYLNIRPNDSVLEIGCGAGRLAIPATRLMSASGSYLGIDIIQDSVRWCAENITSRFPNFRFHFENVASQIHNASGTEDPATTTIPLPDSSVDKIFLSSVFTHMFPAGVSHYLREFRRVLRPDGIALATLFFLNTGSKKAIESGKCSWTFSHRYVDNVGHCWVESAEYPEAAVAYEEDTYLRLTQENNLQLRRQIIYGTWSGQGDALADGQDYSIFGRENP